MLEDRGDVRHRLIHYAAALPPLVVYLLTLGPTFGFVDKGEMAAVASTLGIAHPTGYPTIMLLGELTTLLLPLREVVALNVLSAVLTAASAVPLSFLFSRLLGSVGRDRDSGNAWASVVASQIVCFTTIWWNQGTSFEVYSLHALLMPLILLLFLRFLDQEVLRTGGVPWLSSTAAPESTGPITGRGVAFAVVTGLSFTNHLSTILLAPALLVIYFWRLGFDRESLIRLIWLAPFFALGLLPYLWLPLRAAVEPALNWGDPSTVGRFFDHVTGRQYRVWMFTNPETFAQQTEFFLWRVGKDLIWAGAVLIPLGFLALAGGESSRARTGADRTVERRGPDGGARRKPLLLVVALFLCLFLVALLVVPEALVEGGAPMPGEERSLTSVVIFFLLLGALGVGAMIRVVGDRRLRDARAGIMVMITLLFVANLFYAGGYDIMEIGPYYLTAVLAGGMSILFGISFLRERLSSSVALGVAATLCVGMIAANWNDADESELVLVEEMAHDVLAGVPPDALIISGQWDFWLAGSFYLQYAEGEYPGVIVVDDQLMRRSWYLDQLERNHPELMSLVKQELHEFRPHLERFERGESYDPGAIERAYVSLLDAMIRKSVGERPVYVTGDVRPEYAADLRRIPSGLALRVTADTGYIPQPDRAYDLTIPEGRIDGYVAKMADLYARAAWARGMYEMQQGNRNLAMSHFQRALSYEPPFDENDIPVLPLNSEEQVLQTLQLFNDLQGAYRQVPNF